MPSLNWVKQSSGTVEYFIDGPRHHGAGAGSTSGEFFRFVAVVVGRFDTPAGRIYQFLAHNGKLSSQLTVWIYCRHWNQAISANFRLPRFNLMYGKASFFTDCILSSPHLLTSSPNCVIDCLAPSPHFLMSSNRSLAGWLQEPTFRKARGHEAGVRAHLGLHRLDGALVPVANGVSLGLLLSVKGQEKFREING